MQTSFRRSHADQEQLDALLLQLREHFLGQFPGCTHGSVTKLSIAPIKRKCRQHELGHDPECLWSASQSLQRQSKQSRGILSGRLFGNSPVYSR